jgi:hypothetical protein
MVPSEPERMCVICRARRPQGELVRHACPPPGGTGLVPDAGPRDRRPGRGFYHCPQQRCREKFAAFTGWRKKCKGDDANVES